MITIISGQPGAGKTAYAVAELAALAKREPDRPVYVMGIKGLTLPHAQMPAVKDWTQRREYEEDASIEEHVFNLEDGALVVIDEAQKVYRPRASTAKVPPHVAALETHRHFGLDFWLLTQFPTQLDPGVRRLAGRHIHLRATWAGRQLLEWSEAEDPSSTSSRAKATRRKYKLPRQAFALYESATKHVKQDRRVPLAVYWGGAAVIGAIFAGYQMVGRFAEMAGPDEELPVTGVQPGEQLAGLQPDGNRSNPIADVGARVEGAAVVPWRGSSSPPGTDLAHYEPRISDRPETAPVYDEVRKVATMPVVAGCIEMGPRCDCYSQQGTNLHFDTGQCRRWIRDRPFNPYRQDEAQSGASGERAPQGELTAPTRPSLGHRPEDWARIERINTAEVDA